MFTVVTPTTSLSLDDHFIKRPAATFFVTVEGGGMAEHGIQRIRRRRLNQRAAMMSSDEAASKLLYLVLDHAAEAWKRPPREWFEAKTQFAVIFGERFVNV